MTSRLARLALATTAAASIVCLLALAMHASASAAVLAPGPFTSTDSFDGPPLSRRWSWMNEDPTKWSLTALPGFLRITTTEQNNNFLFRTRPAGQDWWIETKVLFTPSQNFQFAGLSIYQDDRHSIALHRAFAAPGACPHCAGNAIYFDVNMGDDAQNFVLTPEAEGIIYLRMVREGPQYRALASENGTDWTQVGQVVVPDFEPSRIGLRAGNNLQPNASQIPADFDYFTLKNYASRIYLPLVQGN
jgi:beta-xylosidase